jgi:hypothetical protein
MRGVEPWMVILYVAFLLVGIPLLILWRRRERLRARAMLSELLAVYGADDVRLQDRQFRTGPMPRASYTLEYHFYVTFRDRAGWNRECFALVRRTGLFGYRGEFVAALANPDGTEFELGAEASSPS